MAFRPPGFILERNFEPAELPIVHLEQNYVDDSKQKREVPTAHGTSIEVAKYVMGEFEEIAEVIYFDTGPELFLTFAAD
jgi:hypothetical protein